MDVTTKQPTQPGQPGIRRGFLLAMAGALLLFVGVIVLVQTGRPTPPPIAPPPRATAPATSVPAVAAVAAAPPARPTVAIPPATLSEALGLEVVSLRLTAAGRALDVRYRVVDPAKAASLDSRENMAYIVDQTTGAQVGTAQPPPPLEVHKPADGRIYGVMLANAGGALKQGSKVTLVVGKAHAKDLTVE